MKKRLLVLMLAIVTLFTLTSCSKKFTVTFDTDGGSRIAPVEVKKGKTVSEPADPTKDGYVFAGWELDGEEYKFSAKVKGDITLKAVWEKAACEHDWAPATYSAPQTCTKCGATEGSAAGHQWVDATYSAPKTCKECGAVIKPHRVCRECGSYKGKKVTETKDAE